MIRFWTEQEDETVRSLSGKRITDETARQALPGRSRRAIRSRCDLLGVPRPIYPREAQKAEKMDRFKNHPLKEPMLAIFREAAEIGAPCPNRREIEAAIGAPDVTMNGIARVLTEEGKIRIEYIGRNRRRVIFPDGKATDWTDAKLGAPPPNLTASAPPKWETDEARAIFAGVRFDDAPVRRDLRRFNRPATRVLTGVTGAWA